MATDETRPASERFQGRTKSATPASDKRRRKPTPGFKVRALETIYYGVKRYREGDVFPLENGNHFEKRRMVRVSDREIERVTSGQDVLERKRQEARGGSAAGNGSRGGKTQNGDGAGDEPTPGDDGNVLN